MATVVDWGAELDAESGVNPQTDWGAELDAELGRQPPEPEPTQPDPPAPAAPPPEPTQPATPEPEPTKTIPYEGGTFEYPAHWPDERAQRYLNQDMAKKGTLKLAPEDAGGRSQPWDSEEHQQLRKSTPVDARGLKELAELLSGEDEEGNPIKVKPEDVTPQFVQGVIEQRKEFAEEAAKVANVDPAWLREFNEDTAGLERDYERPWSNETSVESVARTFAAMSDETVVEDAKALVGREEWAFGEEADLTPGMAREALISYRESTRTPEMVAADEAILEKRPGYVARKDQPWKATWAENLLREYQQKYGNDIPTDKRPLFDRANKTYKGWLKGKPGGADEEFDAWRSSSPYSLETSDKDRDYETLSEAMVARHAYGKDMSWVPYTLKRIPFAGGAVEAADLLQLRGAVKNVEAGEATDSDWFTIASAMDAAEKSKDPSFLKEVWDVASIMPGFATEFMMTGGAFSAARTGVRQLAVKLLGRQAMRKMATRAAVKTAGFAVGGAARVSLLPGLVAGRVAGKWLPEYEITQNEANELTVAITREPSKLEAVTKGVASAYAEVVTEMAGEAVGVLGRAFGKSKAGRALAKMPVGKRVVAIKGAVARRMLAKGIRPAEVVKRMNKMGLHDPITEIGEEKLNDIAGGVLGFEDDFGATGQLLSGDPEGVRQLAVEALAFAFMPVIGTAMTGAEIALTPKNVRDAARWQGLEAKLNAGGNVSRKDALVIKQQTGIDLSRMKQPERTQFVKDVFEARAAQQTEQEIQDAEGTTRPIEPTGEEEGPEGKTEEEVRVRDDEQGREGEAEEVAPTVSEGEVTPAQEEVVEEELPPTEELPPQAPTEPQPPPTEEAAPEGPEEAEGGVWDNLPTWIAANLRPLAEQAEKTGLADKIEELAAQRKTAAQIAEELTISQDIVKAVRINRGIPRWTTATGMAGAAVENREFTEWLKTRAAPEAVPPAETPPRATQPKPAPAPAEAEPAAAEETPPLPAPESLSRAQLIEELVPARDRTTAGKESRTILGHKKKSVLVAAVKRQRALAIPSEEFALTDELPARPGATTAQPAAPAPPVSEVPVEAEREPGRPLEAPPRDEWIAQRVKAKGISLKPRSEGGKAKLRKAQREAAQAYDKQWPYREEVAPPVSEAAPERKPETAADRAAMTQEIEAKKRAEGQVDAKAGIVSEEALKYAPVHTLPEPVRLAMQQWAEGRLQDLPKGSKRRAALEKIRDDAGRDVGPAVENEKERMLREAVGYTPPIRKEVSIEQQRRGGYREKEDLRDPIGKALGEEGEARDRMIDAAIASAERGKPDALAARVQDLLETTGDVPFATPDEVVEWLNSLREGGPQAQPAAEAAAPEGPAPGVSGEASKPLDRPDVEPKPGTATGAMLQPVQMPELFQLAKDLMEGKIPQVKRLRGVAGRFKGMEGIGPLGILIDPSTATDEQALAQTLAHEIGHLTDFLPDNTLKRGNLLGRLKSLRNFLKSTMPALEKKDQARIRRQAKKEAGKDATREQVDAVYQRMLKDMGLLANSAIRDELIDLTKWWSGDYTGGQGSYVKYRESSRELYAEALSVFLNSPGDLETQAPVFYQNLLDDLDSKPEVLEEYSTLQQMLNGTGQELAESRTQTLREMFGRSWEHINNLRLAQEEQRKSVWSGITGVLGQYFLTSAQPVLTKLGRKPIKRGESTEAEAARFALDELFTIDSPNHTFLRNIDEQVYQPLIESMQERGLSREKAEAEANFTLGEYLFNWRVANERDAIANPAGFTATPSTAQLDAIKRRIGDDAYAKLQEYAQRFHNLMYARAEEAADEGVYNRKIFDEVIAPNKDNYAAFRVTHYIDDPDVIATGVIKQVGTFSDIQNPFESTVLKVVRLNRLIELNRAKNRVRQFLEANFPDDIKPVEMAFTGEGRPRVPKKRPGRGKEHLIELVDGHPAYFEVPTEIAKSFSMHDIGGLGRIAAMVNSATYKIFHPIFVRYNPGFVMANPFRDLRRTWVNLGASDNVSLGQLLYKWGKALPTGIRREKGIEDQVIQDMIDNHALDIPYTDIAAEGIETQIDQLFQKHGLRETQKPRLEQIPVIGKVLEFIAHAGAVTETATKVAGWRVLEEKGTPVQERSYRVRKYVGTPDYSQRGLATAITNSAMMYSRVRWNGLQADISLATNPETAAGWWWRQTLNVIMPTSFAKIAAYGGFGFVLRAMFGVDDDDDESVVGKVATWTDEIGKRVAKYFLTDYDVIPLGVNEDGKAVFATIPRDDLGKFIARVWWHATDLLQIAAGQKLREGEGVRDVVGNQFTDIKEELLPSFSPPIEITSKWLQYGAGINPVDSFYNQQIVPHKEWTAGGWQADSKMIAWTLDEFGAPGAIVHYPLSPLLGESFETGTSGGTEAVMKTVGAMTGLKRLLRVSDSGLTSDQWARLENADQEATAFRLSLPDSAQEASTRRYFLMRREALGDTLSEKEQNEMHGLNLFYNAAYVPLRKMIQETEDAGEDSAQFRDDMKRAADDPMDLWRDPPESLAKTVASYKQGIVLAAVKPPPDPEDYTPERYREKLAEYSQTLPASQGRLKLFGPTHAEAQQLLLEAHRKSEGDDRNEFVGDKGKVPQQEYIDKGIALAKLYGEPAPEKAFWGWYRPWLKKNKPPKTGG